MGCCCSKYSPSVKPLISSDAVHSFDETQSFSGQSRRSTQEAWSITGHLTEKYQDVAKFGLVEVSIDDMTGQPVIVVSRCRFPSKRVFNHKSILQYLKYTLDKYVESDYSIVYFHYSPNDENRPSFSWLKEAYNELDRKYKKNLKCMYIVHPSPASRIVLNLFKPILSAKFGKKLRHVDFLFEIASEISLPNLPIPSEVLQYDKFVVEKQNKNLEPSTYQNIAVEEKEEPETAINPHQQFGVSLTFLEEQSPDRKIPKVLEDTVTYLYENGLQSEGLFRKSPSATALESAKSRYNQGEEVTFDDPHLAASTLKSFLRKLPEPLLTYEFFQYSIDLMNLNSEEYISKLKIYLKKLPQLNYFALEYLIRFLCSVVENSDANLMTISNLAIVFGPSLLWSTDEASSLNAVHTINNLIATLINQFDRLFTEEVAEEQNITADEYHINTNEILAT